MRVLPCVVLLFLGSGFVYGQKMTNESFQRANSLYNELNPVLSPDGKTLFFTIANHPDNIGSKRDPGDIWYSRWEGTQWSSPMHAGSTVNDRAYNAVAGLSPDGQYLYLLSHYDASGNTARTQGISIAELNGTGWSAPRNIVIPYFQNKSSLMSGSLSGNNEIFVFSAETYGTFGVDDLYVSINENGKWTEPKNLGPMINTQFQELSPSLTADGKTLYFSSNGLKGQGSFDVFSSTRLDDTWTNWSKPVSMGTVNSEGRELFYRDYPELGFSLFTSTKNSDVYSDIKVYGYHEQPSIRKDSIITIPIQPDTIITINEVTASPALKPAVVKVYGKVTDSKSGQPVNASLIFIGADQDHQVLSASTEAGYTADIPSSAVYHIKIESRGYVSALEKLDIHTYEMNELEMNFGLQPVEIGTTVNLKSVLFAQAKTELLPESYDELDLVVSFLKENPKIKIELSGHTDNRGVHADNIRLSQQRVNTVKNYLVSKGIDAKRITGKGYGGTKPIASNDSEETRKMNRRVEFIIKKF
jgi:OOP family OmpA-OmpF porin